MCFNCLNNTAQSLQPRHPSRSQADCWHLRLTKCQICIRVTRARLLAADSNPRNPSGDATHHRILGATAQSGNLLTPSAKTQGTLAQARRKASKVRLIHLRPDRRTHFPCSAGYVAFCVSEISSYTGTATELDSTATPRCRLCHCWNRPGMFLLLQASRGSFLLLPAISHPSYDGTQCV